MGNYHNFTLRNLTRSKVGDWKLNRGTGTNEIALETEARSKLGSILGIPVTNKYCTKSRAIYWGAGSSALSSYDDDQLVKYSDVKIEKNIIYFTYTNSGLIPVSTGFAFGYYFDGNGSLYEETALTATDSTRKSYTYEWDPTEGLPCMGSTMSATTIERAYAGYTVTIWRYNRSIVGGFTQYSWTSVGTFKLETGECRVTLP